MVDRHTEAMTADAAADGAVPTEPLQVLVDVDNEQGQERDLVMQGQDCERWRDQALRLQADMDNFRKRQQRLSQDRIETDRNRLLGTFLGVIGDLERALDAPAGDSEALRQGIQLTHRAALHLLQQEGVEQVEAERKPFDPTWHEAVATVRANGSNPSPGTVVEVVEPGYRLGDQLLRPAKVVVAV